MSETLLIVGLGNPGKDYEYTRHNLGFLVVQDLLRQEKLKLSESSSVKGLTAEGVLFGEKVVFLLPMTYVNNSGSAVKAVVFKKGIATSNILTVVDDVNVDFGKMRLRPEGSAGGHNGLKSMIEHLGTREFARLRLGVGSPRHKEAMADYVLGEFTKDERKHLGSFIQEASECCVAWVKDGMSNAMNQFNRRKNDE